ncbi:MAG: hypothetical protein PHP55_10070 [Methanoculleus sp.]|nr:hypothetical protein [Methanoculleus sp.]
MTKHQVYDLYYFSPNKDNYVFRKRHFSIMSAIKHQGNLASMDDGYCGDGLASVVIERDGATPEPKRNEKLRPEDMGDAVKVEC